MNKSNKDTSNQNSDVASWGDLKNTDNSSVQLSTDGDTIGADRTDINTTNTETTDTNTGVVDDSTNDSSGENENQESKSENESNYEDDKDNKDDKEYEDDEDDGDDEIKTDNERVLNELTKLYKNLNKHLQELYCDQDEFDKNSEQLSEKISDYDSTNHSVDLAKSKIEQTNIETELEDIQNNIKKENETNIDDNSTKKEELRNKIETLNDEIKMRKANEDKLREQNLELENKLKEFAKNDDGTSNSNEEIKNIKLERDRINEELRNAESELGKINENYNMLEQEYNKLQEKQQKELEAKELRVTELVQEEDRLKKMLEENKNKYEELNRLNQIELNKYKDEIGNLKKQLDDREKKLSQFENKGELSDKIQEELSQLKANAAKHVITIADITKKLSEKEAEIEKNKQDLLKYQNDKESNLKKIEDLQKQIADNNGNKELTEKYRIELEKLQEANKKIEDNHKIKMAELQKEHENQLKNKQQELDNLIKINEKKTQEHDIIISQLKIELENKGASKIDIDRLKQELKQAEDKKKQNIHEMQKLKDRINELEKQLRKNTELVVSPVGNISSSPSINIPSPIQSESSSSSIKSINIDDQILDAPYIGLKVAFPKDRMKIKIDDNIIAPYKGNPLALAIILTRPECWFWKPFMIGTEVEKKNNEKKMREIESIVRNNNKKGQMTVNDYVYIHSINDNVIAPAINGIKFSTGDKEDPIIKFAKLAKGKINKPLKIVLQHNNEKIIIYVKRLRDMIMMPNCLKENYGGSDNKKKTKKGGGKMKRMDFDILENIKELHYDNIIKETEKLKNQLDTKDTDINEKMNKLETYNKEFNDIYIKYEKRNLSYENWKIVSNIELDNRELFNDNIKELKDLLYTEIKKNPKKDYIEINLLENKEIEEKLFGLGNKKIFVKCKENNEDEILEGSNTSSNETDKTDETSQPGQTGGASDEEYNCIPVKLIDEEDCKKIKTLVNDIIKLLNEIRDKLGIKEPLLEEEDEEEETNNDDPNKTITGLMSQIRAENFDSTGTKEGNAEILTKSTMIIYNIILGLIVILCISTIILHIFNIIKFLYKSFLEIGRVQHNNLETGETFRYKLLQYITYINTCNLPSVFSSFNSKQTTSETIIKLSKIVNEFFKKSEDAGIQGSTEFKDMLNDMSLEKNNDELEDECEIAWSKWLKENPNKGQPSEKVRICQEIKEKNKITKNNSQKEPLFNIFMIMRLFFMTIKLYLAFFMIVIIVFIIYVLLTKVAALTSMPTLKMNPFAKQISFMTLLQSSGVCFIYIITSFLIYKFMFLKLYSKYLETYLHIIAIDFELNKIKKNNDNPDILDTIDTNYSVLLHDKIDNDDEIEEKIIQFIEDPEISENKIVKYIIYYVLIKHIYNGKNKEKLSHLKAYSYFINTQISSNLSTEILVDINTTYYSLIPNKYRKVPLQYFKFNNIKKLSKNIERGERIRKEVNSKLSILNDYIASVNKEFDDDNYIVNLGWYFLINLIISTIFIGILIVILVKGWREAGNNFYNFVKMDID